VDTVPLIIWSAAEMAVTLICIGIPTLRPFWRHFRKQGDESDGQAYKMDNLPRGKDAGENNLGFHDANTELGIRGPSTITQIAGDNHGDYYGDNRSDKSILGPEYRNRSALTPENGTICVKQDVQVEWTNGSAGGVGTGEKGRK
jgi:hypothetical protein